MRRNNVVTIGEGLDDQIFIVSRVGLLSGDITLLYHHIEHNSLAKFCRFWIVNWVLQRELGNRGEHGRLAQGQIARGTGKIQLRGGVNSISKIAVKSAVDIPL